MKNFRRSLMTLGFLAVSYLMIWFIWIRGQELAVTLAFLFVAALTIGLIFPSGERIPLGPQQEADIVSQAPPGFELLLGLAAMAAAFVAYKQSMVAHWGWVALAIVGGALAWRFRRPLQLPVLSIRSWKFMVFLAVLAAALFRLFKAGDIPHGFVMVDEPHILLRAREYANGLRQTYAVGDNWTEGVIPLYLEAFGLKLFGGGMLAWRLESILIGILLTPIFYHIGRDMDQPWLGLGAALFWAMSVWAVTVSRAPFFVTETHLIVLLCFLFLFKALRGGFSVLFALAGLFWGFCFSTYVPGQVMLALVPWALVLIWLFKPGYRSNIQRGVLPLLGGLLIGLGPLLLWGWQNYPSSVQQAYFSHLYLTHEAGQVSGSTLHRFDSVLSRAIGQFPIVMSMLTTRGPAFPYFLPRAFPVIQPVALGLFFLGLSVCIARFRRGFHTFLIYWWFGGLLPSLVANPGGSPEDRRTMMILPPMLLIAGVGLLAAVDTAAQAVPPKKRAWTMLALLLVFFGWYGVQSWKDYFVRNQNEYDLLTYDRANAVSYLRAVYDQNRIAPVVVVTTRRLYNDSWTQPSEDPFRGPEFDALNPRVPLMPIQLAPNYYLTEGLAGALKWALTPLADEHGKILPQRDVLVALTPFYFYLEPLLHRLGGKTVAELPLVNSNEGLVRGDVSMAADKKLSMKFVRISGLKEAAVEMLRKDGLYQFSSETLLPPEGTPEAVRGLDQHSPAYRKLAQDYVAQPQRWRISKRVNFSLPDPWFWSIWGQMPVGMLPPLRLRAGFVLDIPMNGDYAFGASSTQMLKITLDGKKVFFRDPDDPKSQIPQGPGGNGWMNDPGFLASEAERRGFVGQAVPLKAGRHRLAIEQSWLSENPKFNQVLRILWQKPGAAEPETLPLEVLEPLPASPAQAPH